jgi:hypothetical protein
VRNLLTSGQGTFPELPWLGTRFGDFSTSEIGEELESTETSAFLMGDKKQTQRVACPKSDHAKANTSFEVISR